MCVSVSLFCLLLVRKTLISKKRVRCTFGTINGRCGSQINFFEELLFSIFLLNQLQPLLFIFEVNELVKDNLIVKL